MVSSRAPGSTLPEPEWSAPLIRTTPADQATAGVALEDMTLGDLDSDKSGPQAKARKIDDLRIDIFTLNNLELLSE